MFRGWVLGVSGYRGMQQQLLLFDTRSPPPPPPKKKKKKKNNEPCIALVRKNTFHLFVVVFWGVLMQIVGIEHYFKQEP